MVERQLQTRRQETRTGCSRYGAARAAGLDIGDVDFRQRLRRSCRGGSGRPRSSPSLRLGKRGGSNAAVFKPASTRGTGEKILRQRSSMLGLRAAARPSQRRLRRFRIAAVHLDVLLERIIGAVVTELIDDAGHKQAIDDAPDLDLARDARGAQCRQCLNDIPQAQRPAVLAREHTDGHCLMNLLLQHLVRAGASPHGRRRWLAPILAQRVPVLQLAPGGRHQVGDRHGLARLCTEALERRARIGRAIGGDSGSGGSGGRSELLELELEVSLPVALTALGRVWVLN